MKIVIVRRGGRPTYQVTEDDGTPLTADTLSAVQAQTFCFETLYARRMAGK